jgi:hypothetical protein
MKLLVPKTALTVITASAALLAIPAMASAAPLHVAAKHASKVSVSASPRVAVAGTTVKLSATVSSASPKPTGSVTFWWGSKKLCSTKLVNRSGHCDTKFTTSGSRAVRGVYSGDSKHAAATGKVTVVSSKAGTTTKISVSTLSATVGKPVTFNAGITTHSPLAATGTVRFFTGSTIWCSGKVSHGAAHCSYTWKSTGSHKVTAKYLGDGAHATSSATSGTITVKAAPLAATTTKITGFAPTPVNSDASETVTVTVTSSSGIPTGKVVVTAPGLSGVGCTATLSGGTGTCSLTLGDGFGPTTFDATYGGDSSHKGSTGTDTVEVRITTTTAVAFAAGTVTATVGNRTMDNISPSAGGTGTVTFYTGAPGTGTAIAACTDVALVFTQTSAGPPATGTNTSTCSSIPAGATTVYAVYSGDDENQGSTSGTVDVTG